MRRCWLVWQGDCGEGGGSRRRRWDGVIAPVVCAVVALLAAAGPAVRTRALTPAQSSISAPAPVRQLGGTLGPMAGEGDRLYVAVGSRVRIVDASVGHYGTILGETPPLTQTIKGVEPAGRWLYVSVGWRTEGALIVFDVADPREPRLAGRLPLPFVPEPLHTSGAPLVVDGDVAWLHVKDTLWAVDVADPARPRLLERWRSADPVYLVQAGGGRALVVTLETNDIDPHTRELVSLSVVEGQIEVGARQMLGMRALGAFAFDGQRGVMTDFINRAAWIVNVTPAGGIEIEQASQDVPHAIAAVIDGRTARLLTSYDGLFSLPLVDDGQPLRQSGGGRLVDARRLAMAGGRLWISRWDRLALAERDPTTESVRFVGEVERGWRLYRDLVGSPAGFVAITADEIVVEARVAQGDAMTTTSLPLPESLVPASRIAWGDKSLLVAGRARVARGGAQLASIGQDLEISDEVFTAGLWTDLAASGDRWLGSTSQGDAFFGSYASGVPWSSLPIGSWSAGSPSLLAPPFAWLTMKHGVRHAAASRGDRRS